MHLEKNDISDVSWLFVPLFRLCSQLPPQAKAQKFEFGFTI